MPFCRRYFQMHFGELTHVYLDWNFTKIRCQRSNPKCSNIDWDNDLLFKRRQYIMWTDDGLVSYRTYGSHGIDEIVHQPATQIIRRSLDSYAQRFVGIIIADNIRGLHLHIWFKILIVLLNPTSHAHTLAVLHLVWDKTTISFGIYDSYTHTWGLLHCHWVKCVIAPMAVFLGEFGSYDPPQVTMKKGTMRTS